MPLGALKTALLVRGLLAVAFGVVALAWPAVTAVVLAILFGLYALVDGAGLLLGALREGGSGGTGTRTGGHRALHVVSGVAGILLGIAALVWPGVTTVALALLVGAWAVVTGLTEVWAGMRLRDRAPASWPLVGVGLISMLAGLALLVWPAAGAVVIAAIVGLYALIAGALMLLSAWRMHRFTGRTVSTAA